MKDGINIRQWAANLAASRTRTRETEPMETEPVEVETYKPDRIDISYADPESTMALAVTAVRLGKLEYPAEITDAYRVLGDLELLESNETATALEPTDDLKMLVAQVTGTSGPDGGYDPDLLWKALAERVDFLNRRNNWLWS